MLVSVYALFAATLFLTAGTWKFWQAWVFLAMEFVPTFAGTIYFYRRDPKLLER